MARIWENQKFYIQLLSRARSLIFVGVVVVCYMSVCVFVWTGARDKNAAMKISP